MTHGRSVNSVEKQGQQMTGSLASLQACLLTKVMLCLLSAGDVSTREVQAMLYRDGLLSSGDLALQRRLVDSRAGHVILQPLVLYLHSRQLQSYTIVRA